MKTEPMEALKFLYSVEDPTDNIPMHLTPKDKADHVCRLAFKEGQSNPKIKQLEWREDYFDIIANTICGKYKVSKPTFGIAFILYLNNDVIDAFFNLDEAKAFAQKDFESRVKECLIIE